MVDLEQLARRARWAGEAGRVRAAIRGAAAVIPLAVIAAAAGGSVKACLCLGLLLFTAAVALRWWHGDGARAASLGLWFGLLPLGASLLTVRLGGSLGGPGAFDPCGPLCLAAGLAAGAGAAYYAMRAGGRPLLVRWAAAGFIASLTAALGCAPMGLASALVIVGAVLVGMVIGAVPRPARAV
jgi:hypothetical protein